MAGQVVPGVIRVEMKYNIPENQIENVFYVQRGLAHWTEAEMDAAEVVFHNWFTGVASLILSDQLNLYEILETDLTDLHGIRKAYPISPPADGNLNAEYLPANVTVAVKASTGIRGRGTNGRVYWPALVDTQVSNQTLQASAGADIISALDSLRAAVAGLGGGSAIVIPHFKVGGVRPPTVSCDPVLQYALSDYLLDSQRLRLPGHKKAKRH